jgi:5-methyltetrahydropteroyltriglutamate--homocysteine methyltransferase
MGMLRNTDRILTTHAGRLDGPPELAAMLRLARGTPVDPEKAAAIVPGAIRDLVKRQVDTGIDIVGDGELGKLGFNLLYYGKRFTGLTSRKVKEGDPGWMSLHTGERLEFAESTKSSPGARPQSASSSAVRSRTSDTRKSRPTSLD